MKDFNEFLKHVNHQEIVSKSIATGNDLQNITHESKGYVPNHENYMPMGVTLALLEQYHIWLHGHHIESNNDCGGQKN